MFKPAKRLKTALLLTEYITLNRGINFTVLSGGLLLLKPFERRLPK